MAEHNPYPDGDRWKDNVPNEQGATKTGTLGKLLIQHFESLKTEAYQDSAGIWTIGIGNITYLDGSKVKKGDKISEEEAVKLFEASLPRYEQQVLKRVNRPLKQNEFDALVSFVYNTGGTYLKDGKLEPYDLWQHVNNNLGKDGMEKYWQNCAITAGGKKLNGLIRRRKSESHLYLTGQLIFG